ncbi:hypothetical protein, conserved [Leishmania braziliensis MHOM/BR/75/M2904]|uniref:Uncharacterized protein n=2 Tax=Leishmania braziliensis TaxID=5660 RepID=A4HJX2_LEIBR|nr:hypothetical protein, conserved [Leishmania braziliensis MHOM/BR/75/M2904]CAM42791.1 hypothetical protein, conserved [Leishmania braziliensis MHOM/BR/75/M2904]
MGVCDTGRCPEECVQLMHEQDSTAKRTPRDGVAGSAHYVALELATLLTPVHASAATMREAAWETALSPAPSAEEHANEPLNDLVWAGSLGRSMLSLPAAAAAIGRPAPPVLPAGLCQATQPSRHSQEPPAAVPLITSTYVVCFPAGCVTWCPASTLGLTSADRRAAAAEVQCVKSWEQLQTAVLRRMWHATHLSRGAAAFSPHARCGAAPGELSAPSMSVALTEPVMCTSIFVSLLLSSACYAYLPNTAKFLGEVDAIDSMLPLIEMNCESDQADALRRVLLLRRRLALHRRLLFQKICLLEALDRPAIHTAAGFIRSLKSPMWVPCSATPVRIAERCKSAGWDSASAGGDRSNHLNASCTDVPWRSGAGTPTGGVARSRHSSEGLDANDSNGRPSPDKSSSDHVAQRVTWAAPSLQHQMAAAPSLNAIHKGITSVLHNLEVARTVLGNTTLIYTSKVNFSNSRTSETADYFSLICQYVLIVVLPLNIVASHWGMNCPVPFMAVEGTTPFWGIVGVLAFIGVTGLIFPFYAYKTRRIYLIA